MATLGNIRKHGALLIGIVGLAMLAFIVGDFLSSGSTYFHRNAEYVGEIEGEKIHYTEYQGLIDQMKRSYEQRSGEVSEDVLASIQEQVWNNLVSEITLKKQAGKIGLTITDEEMEDLCYGNHIHQYIQNYFSWGGEFNKSNVLNYLQYINNDVEDEAQRAQIAQMKEEWKELEKAVRMDRLQTKYFNLVASCLGANSLDAEFAHNAGATTTNVEYVVLPLTEVSEEGLEVKDSDIKDLYKKHKKQFKLPYALRSIEYITFPIVPAQEDYEEAEAAIKKVAEEFKTTDDLLTVVNLNSDITYDARNLSKEDIKELGLGLEEFCFGPGAVAGACTEVAFNEEAKTYHIARIVKAGYALPDSVKIQPIVADSLLQEGQEAPEAMWVTEAMLPKDFAEKVFGAAKGQRITYTMGVQEQEYDVVEMTAAKPKVQVAILARNVIASSRTDASIYNEAKQFIVNNGTEQAFQDAAVEKGMVVRPANNMNQNTPKVNDLKSSRAIVRWAFGAKEGDVSDVFSCGNQYVVAVLTGIEDGEYVSLETVSASLRAEAMNDKKAEKAMETFAGVKTLEEAAQKLDSAEIKLAENVSLAGLFDSNNEPAVAAAALNLAKGEVKVVKGLRGVYVIKGGDKTTAETEFNKEATIQSLNSQLMYTMQYRMPALLKEKADIEDNRANFY